jgi:Caspase domain
MRWLGLLLVAAFLAATLGVAKADERRVAIVIGNEAYKNAPPLKNPVNDAKAIAQLLRGYQFDVVEREDATKADMERAILDFGSKLGEGGIALVYYSGHGLQVGGKNYLIPVDAEIDSERMVPLTTVDVEDILAQMMDAKSRINLVILDACRNNPFERSFRSLSRGLAVVDAPEGTLIAFATAPGRTASDGDGGNGLYTQELLRAIRTPGVKIEDMFKQVRVAVSGASNDQQVPWESSSLTGDFYFTPPTAPAAAAAPPQQQAALPPPAKPGLSGKWQTATVKASYDDHISFSLAFEFLPQGNGSFAGTVTESGGTDYGRTYKKTRVIIDGKSNDNTISFVTQEQAVYGNDSTATSYKAYYSGTLNEAGDELRLTRLRDFQGGGDPESFVAHHQ